MTVTMAQTPASTPFSPAFRPNLEVFEKIVSSEKKKRKPPSKYVCPSPPLKSPFNSYGLPSTIYTPTARSLGTPQSVLTEERGGMGFPCIDSIELISGRFSSRFSPL